MDSTNQTLSSPTLLITIIILLCLFIYSKLSKPKKASNKPPQAGGAWPIIGHLHKLSGTGLPHMTLGAMADQYGSAFTIQLGTKQALVVSSWKVAKECFTTNDRALASRPSSIASKIMGYNNGTFALTPYGQYWREVRKIAVQEFLSNRRLESLKHTWKTEIEVSMKELHDTWASTNNKNNNSQVLVEMKQWFTDLTMNIVMRLVVGKRWFGRNVSSVDEAEVRQCERTMKRFFTLAGTFMVEDSVPLVGWLDVQGYRREMRSIARELERVLEGLLEEHKCRRRDGKAEQEQDFMDVMLSALKETPNFTDRDPDTINKATCLWFADLTMNIVARLVVGKRRFGKHVSSDEEEAARQLQRVLKRFVKLVGVFMVEDAVPFVGRLDLQGYRKEMKSLAMELESLMQGLLEEHRRKRGGGDGSEAKKEQDFMDVMLSVLNDTVITDRDPDTVNKATCLTIMVGAADTTTVTLIWALSLLLNNPHKLKKVQEELEAQVGNHRHVDESDIKNLEYLQAIIKETLRLYPAAPLSGPRESIEDAVVAGYHVPAGTRLIMNLWKIQRDPSIWTNPLEFRPERFLTTHQGVDVWGQHYELTPFGSGRRSCPGAAFALQVVTFTLARFLHGFKLAMPNGAPVDMTESVGLTNVKATPLEVLLAPRLPLKLYEA